MATYVIMGASKGIGWEMVRAISQDPANLVVGLVRSKEAVEKRVSSELSDRKNVTILHGDLTSYDSIAKAASDTGSIVGDRGVDYLIANGAFPSHFDAYDPIADLGPKHEELEQVSAKLFSTNVVGNIHLFTLFTPLLLKGTVKKCFAISSGHGDIDFINQNEVEVCSLYGASKAAMNVIVAKFAAQFKKDGVLFMSMSPGVVDVGHFEDIPAENMQKLGKFFGQMQAYAPHFKGPVPVDQAVVDIRAVWERATIESGYSGAFVSHYGNKQWV